MKTRIRLGIFANRERKKERLTGGGGGGDWGVVWWLSGVSLVIFECACLRERVMRRGGEGMQVAKGYFF